MRSAVAALLLVVAIGVGALAKRAANTDGNVVQTAGVSVVGSVVKLGTKQEACEQPLALTEPVRLAQFNPGGTRSPSPPLIVTLRDFRSRRPLATARLGGDWDPAKPQTVPLNRMIGDR